MSDDDIDFDDDEADEFELDVNDVIQILCL